MSYYINSFLSTELTCIPQFMDKYIGKYYSNTAGNALTWVFVMWNVLHFIFDQYLDVLLKKMQYKMYRRKRLIRALWYCGFFGTSFLYCSATMYRNNINIFEFRRNLPMEGGPIPPHIMLGLGLFGTFFFHSCTWDMYKHGPEMPCISYLILSFLPVFTYFTRRIELYLSLLALISFSQCSFNFLRCIRASNSTMKNFTLHKGMLYAALGAFAVIHVLLVPILFLVPLLYSMMKHNLNFPTIMLVLTLISWWIVEALANPLYKYVYHWVHHCANTNQRICPGCLIECSLFPPRDDVAFNLALIRKEIKEREERMISKRKPKNRGMLIQTLKCMVAIKRKLKQKRQSNSSESSEDSESERVERSSDEDESSSSDENSDVEDEKKREAREYQEETARALMEDKENMQPDEGGLSREVSQEKTESDDDKKND